MVKWTSLFVLFTVLFSCFLFAMPVHAADAEPAQFSDTLIKKFQERFGKIENDIREFAKRLFYFLFLSQFTWAVIQLFLQESLTFVAVIATVVRQIMMGGFFWWILADRTVLEQIIASFSQMAKSGITVSDMLFVAEVVAEKLMAKCAQSTGVLSGFAVYITGLAASIVVLFTMATAVSYIAIVMIENFIVSSLGVILLGFGGSEYTRNYALSYIKTLVHIGFKLFLASIFVVIALSLLNDVVNAIVTDSNSSIMQGCLQLIACSFLLLAIIKVIPLISDTLISGVSMGIGAGGAAIRSGAAGAAGFAVGATIGTVGTGINAVGAAANAYHSSRSSGKGGLRSAGSAAASAFGSSILGVRDTARNVFNGVKSNLGFGGGAQSWGRMGGEMKKTYSNFSLRGKDRAENNQPESSMSAPTASPMMKGTTSASSSSPITPSPGGKGQTTDGALKAPDAEELSKKFKSWS